MCVCFHFGRQDLRVCMHLRVGTDGQLQPRTIFPAHCVNIDRQQVSQSERKAAIKRGRSPLSMFDWNTKPWQSNKMIG